MSEKRKARTVATITLAVALLTGCTGTVDPTPTTDTSTTTPTPTETAPPTYEAPASEVEAIAAAEDTIDRLLTVNAEVSQAGGTDPSPYEAVATGVALEIYTDDAKRIAEGPILNEDQESVEGQSTVVGALTFEPTTGYGQDYEGIPNGLVTIPGCLDGSARLITTADGKPAMKNPNPRNVVEYQVVYLEAEKTWKVYNEISTGETC